MKPACVAGASRRNEAASGLARTGASPAVGASPLAAAVGASPLAAKFKLPVVHRMGRRCRNWDYRGRGVYLITIAAATRGRGVWGRVERDEAGNEAASGLARTGASPTVGASPAVGASPLAAKFPAKFTPNEIGLIIEREWLRLDEVWPGVKLLAHQVMEDHFHGVIATPSYMAKPLGAIVGSFKARASSEAGVSLWAKGYVDTILFDGAAVVSPCISEGERELARQAFEAGAKVITLQNKGFSPLYKPGGKYFESCADGRLLMLAPAAWPYLPGEKPITRASACTLNRIAQLIAGPGAAIINYRGMKVNDVDRLVAEAARAEK